MISTITACGNDAETFYKVYETVYVNSFNLVYTHTHTHARARACNSRTSSSHIRGSGIKLLSHEGNLKDSLMHTVKLTLRRHSYIYIYIYATVYMYECLRSVKYIYIYI